MDGYDKSPLVDYAYNGLAQIAFPEDYKKADRYFSKALDKGLAASKLKEITLGEGLTLLALNRPLDAKPLFEQVASTRAWRGEATALSVFSLGEIQMDQENLPRRTPSTSASLSRTRSTGNPGQGLSEKRGGVREARQNPRGHQHLY